MNKNESKNDIKHKQILKNLHECELVVLEKQAESTKPDKGGGFPTEVDINVF